LPWQAVTLVAQRDKRYSTGGQQQYTRAPGLLGHLGHLRGARSISIITAAITSSLHCRWRCCLRAATRHMCSQRLTCLHPTYLGSNTSHARAVWEEVSQQQQLP
jgi:hypothetical protein